MQAPLVMPRVATRYRSCYNNYFQNILLETFPKNLFYYFICKTTLNIFIHRRFYMFLYAKQNKINIFSKFSRNLKLELQK